MNNNGLNSQTNENNNTIPSANNQNTLGNIVNQNLLNQTIPTRSEYQSMNSQSTAGVNNGLTTNTINNQAVNTEVLIPNNNGLGTVPTQINNNEKDNTFTEIKKKPIGAIIAIILLLLIIGGGAAYYFIIDNPQRIFTAALDRGLNSIKNIENYNKYNLEYSLDIDLTGDNEEYKELYEIASKIAFSGSLGKDNSSQSVVLNTTYDKKALPSIQLFSENNTVYLSVKDLLDKVIKVENTIETEDESISTDINDYKVVIDSLVKALKETMESANYSKKYTKLNDKYVKQITLTLDKEFNNTFFTKLINDEKFIDSFAKIDGSTPEEVSDMLNDSLTTDEEGVELVSLYLGIINNEFIMISNDAGADYQIKINKEDNKYSFEYSEDYTLMYQGNVIIKKDTEKESELMLEVDLLDEKTVVKLDYKANLDTSKGVDKLDTKNAISVEELTEEDLYNMLFKLLENDAINAIVKDTGLDSLMNTQDIGI